MNIIQSFANWLGENSIATLGQDLRISRAPNKPNHLFWLLASGGAVNSKNVNRGVRQSHTISVYCRDDDPRVVYDSLHTLEELVLTAGCISLEGYVVTDLVTAGPFTDQDLDSQSRTIGLLEITVETYRS